MIYPLNHKPPIWAIDSGIVAYNCRKHGFPHPIVAMPMWEGAGNRAMDYSGHSNNGVLTNGANWTGEDINFDGTDDNVELTDIDRSTPFPQITVSCHVSLDAKTDFDTILEKNDSISVSNNMVFRIFLDNSGDQLWRWKVWGADGVSAGNVDSDAAAVTGEFTHILGSYDGSEVAMWVNDIKQAITQAETGNIFSASNNMRLGAGGAQRLDGKFKSLVVFNKALTAAQKTFLHNNPYFMYQIPEELYGYTAAVIEAYLTLSQTMTATDSGQANTQGPVILSNLLTTADGGQANALAPVTLSNILIAADGGAANALAPVTLSDILSITKSAAMITPQSMNFAESFDVAESGLANTQAPTTLSNILSLTLGAEAVAESTITISKTLALLQTYIAESNRSISLEEILTAVLSSESTAESTLTLSDILALSITEANIFNTSVTLACIQQFADSGMVTAGGNTTLNETLALIQSGLVDAGSETTLSDVLSIISSSEANTGAFVTFANNLSIAQNTAEITQAYLTLAYNLSVQNQAVSTAASTLALAINAGISASLVVDAEADLILPQTLTQTQSASKIAHSNLDINNILSISILAEALAVAGISLDMVEAIDTNTIQVELPDGRTVIIKVEVRTVAISQDDRTVTIS